MGVSIRLTRVQPYYRKVDLGMLLCLFYTWELYSETNLEEYRHACQVPWQCFVGKIGCRCDDFFTTWKSPELIWNWTKHKVSGKLYKKCIEVLKKRLQPCLIFLSYRCFLSLSSIRFNCLVQTTLAGSGMGVYCWETNAFNLQKSGVIPERTKQILQNIVLTYCNCPFGKHWTKVVRFSNTYNDMQAARHSIIPKASPVLLRGFISSPFFRVTFITAGCIIINRSSSVNYAQIGVGWALVDFTSGNTCAPQSNVRR
jgi:hypothetical protein